MCFSTVLCRAHAFSVGITDARAQGLVGCTVALSQLIPLPRAAPAATSVGKCFPAATRSALTPTAPAYSRIALRVRWGRCWRRASTRYDVAAAKASDAWPEGSDCWLSRSAAAAAAPLV